LHRTRVLAGGLTGYELAVDNYDDLTVSEVVSAVQQTHLHRRNDFALLRYEPELHPQELRLLSMVTNVVGGVNP
jgi:hypothetical protein